MGLRVKPAMTGEKGKNTQIVDMSFKYFLDMAPEEDVINPSTLTKFRRLRLKDMDLLNLLISKTVTIAIEKGDGPQLPILVEISKDNGIQVDTIIADTAYSGATNLKLAEEQQMELIAKLNLSISQDHGKDTNLFYYNKDAGMYVCPAGHQAIRKAKDARKQEKKNAREIYYTKTGIWI